MSKTEKSRLYRILSLLLAAAALSVFLCTAVNAAPKLSKKKVTLLKGQTVKLKVKGTKKKVTWKSSKKSVASVKKGLVTAKKKGTATITAKVGGKKLKCKVTVEAPKLSKKELTLEIGKKATLKLKNTKQKVKWASSNKKIAKVSKKGKVTACAAGTAEISATVLGESFICKVTVEEAEQDETEQQQSESEQKQSESEQKQSESEETVVKQVQPTIETKTVVRTGYFDKDGNPSAAVDAIPKDISLKAVKITFKTLPTNLAELKQYESLLKDKNLGKFVIYSLYAATLKAYDGTLAREKNDTVYDMMSYLCDSPYALSVNSPFNQAGNRQFMDDSLKYQNAWTWFGNAFFNTSWQNGYKLSAPYVMELEEYVYLKQKKTAETPEYQRIANYGTDFGKKDEDGNDIGNFSTVRNLCVTWSDAEERWFIFGNDWRSLLANSSVKKPAKTF